MSSRRRHSRVWLLVLGLLLIFVAACVYTVHTIPRGNTGQSTFDVILVLGSPTELQGEISAEQRWRVEEGVRELRAGRAPRLLFSGAAVAYPFVEARAMAAYARGLGVPRERILLETQARNTIQNIGFSEAILRAHGWRSMEVISSPDHLPRAALILQALNRKESHRERNRIYAQPPPEPLLWRVHASPAAGRGLFTRALYGVEELVVTALLRWFGLGLAPVLHAFAWSAQHVGYAARWVWYHLTGQVHRLR